MGQFRFAFVVFSIVECVPAAMLFRTVNVLYVALPAALGGAIAWSMMSGRAGQVACLRAALAGALGSILVPLCLFVGFCALALLFDRDEGTLSQLVGGTIAVFIYAQSLFLYTIVYLILMGLVSGLACRALAGFLGTQNKARMIAVFTGRAAQMWAAQVAIVFLVFIILGFLTALTLLTSKQAPLAALGAGISGAAAWAVICGRLRRPAWWRAALTGALAGLVVHPYAWFLASFPIRYSPLREPIQLVPVPIADHGPMDLDIFVNSLGSFGDWGLVTVCVAIASALACRALGGFGTPDTEHR